MNTLVCHPRFYVALFFLVTILCCYPLLAQDRMPPISSENMTPKQRLAVAGLLEARGIAPRGPWVPLLRSPEVMQRARAMGDYARYNTSLPPRLSEFLILMTAREWTQQYEWYAHSNIAVAAGLDPDIVKAIAEGRHPEVMGPDEAILYSFFTELHSTKGISDATYEQAIGAFGERGIIDSVGIIGYYTLLAMTMNVARTPIPGNPPPPLQPFTTHSLGN